MREGGEQRARCGQAEAGAHFIGPGRRRGGGEVAGGGGVLILVGFEGIKGKRRQGSAISVGGVKAVRWRFDSALCARRRVAVGGARRGSAGHWRRRLCRMKEGDDPLGGPSWAEWANVGREQSYGSG
jgi:hypothetical protein